MKKVYLLSIFLLLIFIFIPAAKSKTSYDSQKVVTLEANQTVNKDYFAFGDVVEIYGTINGDLYALGGEVIIEGIVNGDILAAGGNVRISGKTPNDARVAGGNITITGEVKKSLTAIGGNVEIVEPSIIGGSLVAAGGNVRVSAPIGKDIKAVTGALVIANTVGGSVEAGVEEFRITSSARIEGNVKYYGRSEAKISDGATILGEVTQQQTPIGINKNDYDQKIKEGKNLLSGFTFLGFVSSLLTSLLLVHFYPKFTINTAEDLRKNLGKNLLAGLLALIGVPIIAAFLMLTIIGLPLGFILFALYFIALYLAKIPVALYIGNLILNKFGQRKSVYWTLTLGLAVFTAVGLFPVVGFIFKFGSLIAGLGTLIMVKRQTYFKAKKENLI